MLHIMHLIESLEFGGAEKVLVHLANKLSEGHKVSVCLTKRKGELASELDPKIQVFFLDTGEGNSLSLPRKLRRLMKQENVDILHSHDWGIYLEATLAVAFNSNTRLIHTVHGHYMLYDGDWKSQLKKRIRHTLERVLTRFTYQIVPVSESIENYILDEIKLPRKKVRVIRNGITPLNKEEAAEPSKILKLVTVGRMAKIKNYPLMLNSIAKVAEKTREFHLTMVGDGPELESLRALAASLNIEELVTFTGFTKEVPKIIKQQDVFLCSSDYEGISIAILEAMSIGLPVIATNVGGIPETVIDQKTGILVAPNNTSEFASAIEQLLLEPEKVQVYSAAAEEYFHKNFHENVVLNGYEELYQNSQQS